MVTCILFFDALITEFIKICLVLGQTPEEGTLWPGNQISRLMKKLVYTGGRRKLYMMPVILMGLGGAKRWGD